jgi:hypothetical protein
MESGLQGKFPVPLVSTKFISSPTRNPIGQHIPSDTAVSRPDHIMDFPLLDKKPTQARDDIHPKESSPQKKLLPPVNQDDLALSHLEGIKLRKVLEVIHLPEFAGAPSLRHQAKILNDYLRSDTGDSICTLLELALVLKMKSAASFQFQIKTEHHLTHRDGRPTLISDEADKFLCKLFQQRYNQKDPICLHETLDLLLDKYGISISLDTFRHYLLRYEKFKIVTGKPIESQRAELDLTKVKSWYNELKELIRTVPREFIFNMDESGCDEYVDSRNLSVIVPQEHEGKHADVPVHRQTKRATLTGCISADGSSLKPFIILPRETVDDEIFRVGYTPDKVVFFHHVHSFMTKRIFEQWMNMVFIPEIDSRRAQYNYFGPTILILDQFSGHNYETLSEHCRTHNIVFKFLIPHSSHLCQPLDLITFADLKRNFNNIRCNDCRSVQSNKIIRMMRAWQHSIAVDTIVSTFAAAGIVSQPACINHRFYCTINLAVSIHLKDLEDRIALQKQMFGSSGETTNKDDPKQKEDIPNLSLHRSFLYPPGASWVNQPITRYPLNKVDEPPESLKRKTKISTERAEQPEQSVVPPAPGSMKQLSLLDKWVARKPRQQAPIEEPGSASNDSDIFKFPPKQNGAQ